MLEMKDLKPKVGLRCSWSYCAVVAWEEGSASVSGKLGQGFGLPQSLVPRKHQTVEEEAVELLSGFVCGMAGGA
jgi:hypothetical protein